MRKSVISNSGPAAKALHKEWKDLNRIARAEMTSEDAQFPIENALGPRRNEGMASGDDWETDHQADVRRAADDPPNSSALC